MILHLLWDEKIIQRIIKTYESVFPNQNDFLIWDKSLHTKELIELKNCHLISNNIYPDLDYGKYDKVIIHGLDQFKVEFIKAKLSPQIKTYWMMWGSDLYNYLLVDRGFRIYHKFHPDYSIKTRLSNLAKKFGYISNHNRILLNFINEYDITLLSSEEEFNLLRKYYPTYTKKLKNDSSLFYYPIDEVLGPELLQSTAKGNNIIVGNSASWTNNHDYAFKFLKDLDLKDKKIITPLSYGGNERHTNEIKTLGKSLFGDKYHSLTEFMPLDKYNDLLRSSEVFIYGNWRQEAIGNIVIALYLGAKVFVSKKSPMVGILKAWKVNFCILEEITQDSLDSPLTDIEKQNNRKRMLELFNWDNLQNKTKHLFA